MHKIHPNVVHFFNAQCKSWLKTKNAPTNNYTFSLSKAMKYSTRKKITPTECHSFHDCFESYFTLVLHIILSNDFAILLEMRTNYPLLPALLTKSSHVTSILLHYYFENFHALIHIYSEAVLFKTHLGGNETQPRDLDIDYLRMYVYFNLWNEKGYGYAFSLNLSSSVYCKSSPLLLWYICTLPKRMVL